MEKNAVALIALPSTHAAADSVAKVAQRNLHLVIGAELGLLVLGTAATTFASAGILPVPGHVLTGVVFLVSFAVARIGRQAGYEERWFDGRATAESIKSLAWQYSMAVPPFGQATTEKDVDVAFLTALAEVARARRSVAGSMAGEAVEGRLITDEMKDARKSTLRARWESYRTGRLRDQLVWYRTAAKRNAKAETRWFWVISSLQLGGVVGAIAAALPTSASFVSPIPVLAALLASFVGWTRTKRFADLAKSYAVTADELASLDESAVHIATEEELAIWVENVEESVSREHKMWLVKRAL